MIQGYVEVVGNPHSLKPATGGQAYAMDGKKLAIMVDGTDGAATITLPAKASFKNCQFFIGHWKGTNYTVLKDGTTTIKTFDALGHCHVVYDSITDAWIAI